MRDAPRPSHAFTLVELPVVSRVKRAAFTLVELLVVIGIIALLVGILLPTLSQAQRAGKDVKCQSNIRQLCASLLNYAAENKGKFPPNINPFTPPGGPPQIQNYWYDRDRIGKYLPNTKVTGTDSILTPVMVCPEDDRGSRSYAMNFWASSGVVINNRIVAPDISTAGSPWGTGSKGSASLILVAEKLSIFADGSGGFAAGSTIGASIVSPTVVTAAGNYPGKRFVGILNISGGDRYTNVTPGETEFDWSRHRKRGDGGSRPAEARGRTNIGFADGHVASFRPEDLAERATAKSKFVARWSPADHAIQHKLLP
jgi:prepilin-type processing-associated H-X9-DG protein/prepilin-type N-terminal cleavage/methylation domain-containing protein